MSTSATIAAPARAKRERPAQQVNQHPQVRWIADDVINAARLKRVPVLDGNQPAEAAVKRKDGPQAQRAAGRVQSYACPSR